MAVKVEIVESLFEEIEKKFKKESIKIFDLMETLVENPRKGKTIGIVGGIVIKEIKYKNFRFFFIADSSKLKFFDENSLVDILLRFVRMSNKNNQQKVIDEIKSILLKIGPSGFV